MTVTQDAYAVCRDDLDWIPISSIANDPETVHGWILQTYPSNETRRRCRVVKVRIKVLP